MAMSGVTVADECQSLFKDMQLKHSQRYLMFEIKDKKNIVLAENGQGEASKSYEDFVAALPESAPRYCVVDVEYTTKSGAENKKLVFIFWCPEGCSVKDKMLYAASKDTIRKALQGVQVEIQANDMSDVEKAAVQSKIL